MWILEAVESVFEIKCGKSNPAIKLQLSAYWELEHNGISEGLLFDEEKHLFTLESTGERLPSVTQVLAKEGLSPNYSWIDPWYSLRGTYIHKATALHDNNNLDESTIDPEIAPYFEAYLKFRKEWAGEIIKIEKRLYHPTWGYAGIIDRVTKTGNTAHILYLRKDGTYRFEPVKDIRHHLNIFLAALTVRKWKEENLKENSNG